MRIDEAIRNVLIAGLHPDRPFGPDMTVIHRLAEQLVSVVRHHGGWQRLQGTSELDVVQEFIDWRRDADSEAVLDGFDLALGYLSGRGLPHDAALFWAGLAGMGTLHEELLRQRSKR